MPTRRRACFHRIGNIRWWIAADRADRHHASRNAREQDPRRRPLPTEDALALVDDARTDIYAAIQKTDGAILRFGRSRRLATALQKLALALRDGGTCAHPGCAAPWTRCDADHDPPWDEGGLTNVESMRHLCSNEHHPHRHVSGMNITFENL